MATALMGLVVLAVIGGITTMLLSSKVHRDQTDGNATLVAAMEQIKTPTPVGRRCPAGSPTPTAPPTYDDELPADVTVESIDYQTTAVGTDADGNPIVTWSDQATACDLTSVLTLQRITLKYNSPNATPTLSFIKGGY